MPSIGVRVRVRVRVRSITIDEASCVGCLYGTSHRLDGTLILRDLIFQSLIKVRVRVRVRVRVKRSYLSEPDPW